MNKVGRRRNAILERLHVLDETTPARLRSFLAQHKRIFVTVDTVQRDLRAMEEVGTVRRNRRTWAGGTYWRSSDA